MIDVVIVGAGPAGAIAAGTLARAGLEVTVIDPRPGGFRIGECLPPAARPLLDDLGLVDAVADEPPGRGTLSAWGQGGLGVRDHLFQPHGDGWTLDRARFDGRLRAWAQAGGAELRAARLTDARSDGASIELRLADAPPIVAGFAVDASGRRAALATRLGAARLHVDALLAVYARFQARIPGDRDPRVLVESTEYGWWYTVRVPSGERIVAMLSDRAPGDPPAAAEFLRRLPETRFIAATLQARDYLPVTRPRGADARTGRLSHAYGDRWAAIGDAAFSVDPLSSQGLVDAMVSAREAARALLAARDGDPNALPAYGARIDALYARYLEHRRDAYASERRFADAAFWRRRHG